MNKILKNYIKNYIKFWMETFGFLFFIVSLFASILGIISAPFQIYMNYTKINNNSIRPDYVVENSTNASSLNNDITYNLLYLNNSNYQYTDNTDFVFKSPIENDYFSKDFYKYVFVNTYTIINQLKNSDSNYFAYVNDAIAYYEQNSNNNGILKIDTNQQNNDDGIGTFTPFHFDNIDKLNLKKRVEKIITNSINLLLNEYKNIELKSETIFQINIDTKDNSIIFNPLNIEDLLNNEFKDILNTPSYLRSYSIWLTSLFAQKKFDGINSDYDMNMKYSFQSNQTSSNISKSKTWTLSFGNSDTTNDLLSTLFNKNKNVKKLNNLVITDGKNCIYNPKAAIDSNSFQEIVISDAFSIKNNLTIGKILTFQFGNYACKNFKIVGIGSKLTDFYASNYDPMKSNFEDFGMIYLPTQSIYDLYNYNKDTNSTSKFKISQSFLFKSNKNESKINDLFSLGEKNNKSVYLYNNDWIDDMATSFSNLDTISSLTQIRVQAIVYFIIAIVIILLAFIFINFIMVKELNMTRKQIGIYKAMGYRTSELSWIFTLKEILTVFIGIICGYFISFPLQIFTLKGWENSTTSYIQPICHNWLFLLIIFIVIPLFIGLLAFWFNFIYLKENIISLINNPKKIKSKKINQKNNKKIKYTSINPKFFSLKLMNSFTRQSLRKFIVINILILFTSLITFIETTALSLINQSINGFLDSFNDKFSGMFNIKGSSFPQLEITNKDKTIKSNDNDSDDGIITIAQNDKRIDYTHIVPYNENDYNNLEKYIIENNTADLSVAHEINTLLNLFSNQIINHPSSLYIPNNVNDLKILINAKSVLIPLIFEQLSDVTDNKSYDDIFDDAKKNIYNSFSNNKINLSGTLIGQTSQNNNQTTYWYLKDISRLIVLLMSGLSVQTYTSQLNNDNPNDLLDQIDNFFVKNSKYELNISNPNNWSIDSPIITGTLVPQNKLSYKNNNIDFNTIINELGGNLSSILMSALIVNHDEKINPLITFNQLYFNQYKDALTQEIGSIRVVDSPITDSFILESGDFSTYYNGNNGFALGNPANVYNFSGIENNAFKTLGIVNNDGSLNTVTSLLFAKTFKLHVGDNFTVRLRGENANLYVNLKLAAINNNQTFSKAIFVDYKTFLLNYSSNIVNYDSSTNTYSPANSIDNDDIYGISSLPISRLSTQSSIFSGNINIFDIAGSIKSLKTVYNSISLTINNEVSIIPTLFNLILSNFNFIDSIEQYSDLKIGDNDLVNNISPFGFSDKNLKTSSENNSSTFDMAMTKSTIAVVTKTLNTLIYIFIAFSGLLITIILVIVMNVIIDESINVILTLKAMGYRKSQINFIILGNYIFAAILIFAFSWILNVVIWTVVLNYVWNNFSILLNVPSSFSSAAINFALISSILLFAYIACDYKNRKQSITKITE